MKKRLLIRIASLWCDRRAVSSLEYGLIGALVFLAIVVGLTSVGANVMVPFATVASTLH